MTRNVLWILARKAPRMCYGRAWGDLPRDPRSGSRLRVGGGERNLVSVGGVPGGTGGRRAPHTPVFWLLHMCVSCVSRVDVVSGPCGEHEVCVVRLIIHVSINITNWQIC